MNVVSRLVMGFTCGLRFLRLAMFSALCFVVASPAAAEDDDDAGVFGVAGNASSPAAAAAAAGVAAAERLDFLIVGHECCSADSCHLKQPVFRKNLLTCKTCLLSIISRNDDVQCSLYLHKQFPFLIYLELRT